MNIWLVELDVSKYIWCAMNEKNMNSSNFRELFLNGNIPSDEQVKDVTFYNKDKDDVEQKGLKPADIMRGGSVLLASQKAKQLIEKEYDGLFRFIMTSIDDFPNEEYYIIEPVIYLELSEHLDMEKTYIKYVANDINKGIFEIRNYCFMEEIRNHHFFRFMYNNGTRYIPQTRYCDDEFKEFVEKNNITGLKFKKAH